jgi:hypothetical protein
MNIFELGWVASPLIGAVVGVEHQATLGVGSVLGGFIGALAGMAAYSILLFCFAVVASRVTGTPLLSPRKKKMAMPDILLRADSFGARLLKWITR